MASDPSGSTRPAVRVHRPDEPPHTTRHQPIRLIQCRANVPRTGDRIHDGLTRRPKAYRLIISWNLQSLRGRGPMTRSRLSVRDRRFLNG